MTPTWNRRLAGAPGKIPRAARGSKYSSSKTFLPPTRIETSFLSSIRVSQPTLQFHSEYDGRRPTVPLAAMSRVLAASVNAGPV